MRNIDAGSTALRDATPLADERLRTRRTARRGHPFYIHIAVLFMVLILCIQIGLGLYTRQQTRQMVLESAENLFHHIERSMMLEARLLRAPIEMAVHNLAHATGLAKATSLEQRLEFLPQFASKLNLRAEITAAHIGYDNGEFFLVRTLADDATRARYKAPPGSAFLVQSVEEARTRWIAFDAKLNAMQEWASLDYKFDPRQRSWYQQALKSDGLIRTEPYAFAFTGMLGRTVAQRTAAGNAVVAADLETGSMSQALRQIQSRLTRSAEMALLTSTGKVLGFSQPERVTSWDAQGALVRTPFAELSPVMAQVSALGDSFADTEFILSSDREWAVKRIKLPTDDGSREMLVIAAPVDELLADADAVQRHLMLVTALVILLAVPVTWWVAHRVASQLNVLIAQADAIRRFDFKTDIPLKTRIREIFGLGRAMKQMKDTIQKFLDVSIALAAERDFDTLMGRVLHEIREAADGDGGVIYLYDEDSHLLKHSSERWLKGDHAAGAARPDLSLDGETHPVAVAAKRLDEPSVHTVAHPRPMGLEYLDEHYGERVLEMVVVPLRGRTGALVGVVCNFMALDKAVPSKERMALVEAFAGAAAVAIDQQRLLQAQKNLLNALIGLMAGAIDSKSPYTGGHCQRVPELTEMLVRAAHDCSDAPFADFKLSDDEWEAIHIAAWLHDCGKVTTPEYVVDKATKLETIYDRIHEVRMRFEVLKRDAEIARLESVAAGGDAALLGAKLEEELRALDDEYRFVASCNEGGEFMSPDKVERLKRIAQRTWQRTLDDRLGVSWEERQRMERTDAVPLPVTEALLADKPEHILVRGPRDLMPEDNPWGFKLKVPAHLYNRGELYNLAIGRGTLTEEERYKINDHIVQTIVMLSQLPFPRHLKGVAELAGGHHEKMDGTGYPKRLQRHQMSIPARIMAIADIFEALTATDRPYKKGKKLSEAIKIMGFMIKDQHIDPDLFKLFLRSGVYLQYAEKYLQPEFIDDVDIAPYLGAA